MATAIPQSCGLQTIEIDRQFCLCYNIEEEREINLSSYSNCFFAMGYLHMQRCRNGYYGGWNKGTGKPKAPVDPVRSAAAKNAWRTRRLNEAMLAAQQGRIYPKLLKLSQEEQAQVEKVRKAAALKLEEARQARRQKIWDSRVKRHGVFMAAIADIFLGYDN